MVGMEDGSARAQNGSNDDSARRKGANRTGDLLARRTIVQALQSGARTGNAARAVKCHVFASSGGAVLHGQWVSAGGRDWSAIVASHSAASTVSVCVPSVGGLSGILPLSTRQIPSAAS